MSSPSPQAAERPPFELGTDGPTAIVVGVDGTETSLRAAAYAAGLARRQRSQLIAVYVRKPPSGVCVSGEAGAAAAVAMREAEDQVEAQLRAALHQQAPVWGVDASLVVRDGDPLRVLSDIVTRTKADAVVVGSSTSVGHRIAGSLAVRLVRQARCPVTVVP